MRPRGAADEELLMAERLTMLRKQIEDQQCPSTDSVLNFCKESKTGTWKRRSGRITTTCKSKIEIEEILYLMERASVTCLDSDDRQMSVKEMYAELVESIVNGDTVDVRNEDALRNYIAYGHLRRSGYKVSRSVEGFTWNVGESKERSFGLKVVTPNDIVDCRAEQQSHVAVVELSKVVFMKLTVSSSAPKPL